MKMAAQSLRKWGLIAPLLISSACSGGEVEVAERRYEIQDDVTGGFFTAELRLKSDGTALLNALAYSSVEVGDSAQYLIPDSVQVTGKWKQAGEQPTFVWDRGIERVRELAAMEKTPVAFSRNLDTAFIFGIPAKLVHGEK